MFEAAVHIIDSASPCELKFLFMKCFEGNDPTTNAHLDLEAYVIEKS